jgi:hypothetical protein
MDKEFPYKTLSFPQVNLTYPQEFDYLSTGLSQKKRVIGISRGFHHGNS